ncbi:hypothetical protein AJ80_02649 [Polytolypa hystricis UAMH7299]|uniref:Uncharacterized protein n=1 Tax=Polytolypa hystricis (strain UAMH7299) TaxID=1447883 RepID=A0A2B7YQH2_POLH7|nr:hypothetical protein AJ80_02649 [Polytolypa hystricis UAMH7299]
MAAKESQCPYKPGETITLQLDPEKRVDARILKVYEPFTCSAVMLVELDHSSLRGEFVLKLLDRRFAAVLETEYCKFVDDGRAAMLFDHCTKMFSKDDQWAFQAEERRWWTAAQRETFVQWFCLLRFQDPSPGTEAHSEEKYVDCPGILLEYIQGFPLREIADKIPEEDWQEIGEETDIKDRSFVLREDPDTKKFEVVILNFGNCTLRSHAKDDDGFVESQAYADEEGMTGYMMERLSKGAFVFQRSTWSEKLQWKYMGPQPKAS